MGTLSKLIPLYSLATLLIACHGFSATELKVSDVVLPDGSNVEFSTRTALQDESTLAKIGSKTGVSNWETTDKDYDLYVDLTSVQDNYYYYTYDFYIRRSSAQPNQTEYFHVQAVPHGDFAPTKQKVQFRVVDQNGDHGGSAELPIFSFFSESSPLDCTFEQSILSVDLSGGTDVSLKCTNALKDLPIVLDSAKVEYKDKKYWQGEGQNLEVNGPNEPLQPGESTHFPHVTLRPKLWQVLTSSIIPRQKPDPSHAVDIVYSYRVPPAERSFVLPAVDIPVRFFPGIWSLLLAVACGSQIGSAIVMLLSSDSAHKGKKWKAFVVAFLLSASAEIIGLILVNQGSKFVLLGLDLDPRQLLPAVFIGVLVGLYGFRNVKKYGKVLGISFS